MDWQTYLLRRRIDIDNMLSHNKLGDYVDLCNFLRKKGIEPPLENTTLDWKWWVDDSSTSETSTSKKTTPVTPGPNSAPDVKEPEKPAWKRKKKAPKKKAPSKNG